MAIISIPTSIGGVALPGTIGQFASGPLASLFGGKSLSTLNYPTELSTDATKSHYVTFSIKEIVPAQYKDTNQGTGIGFKSAATALEGVTSQVGGKIQTAVDSVSPFLAELGIISTGSETGVNITKAISSGLKEGLQVTAPIKNTKAIISLYMPDTVLQDYSAQWDTVSMRDILGSTIQSVRALEQLAPKGFSAAGGASGALNKAGAVWGAVSSDPFIQDKIAKGIGKVAGFAGADSSGLAEVLLQGQGFTSNPQLQMLYRGLGVRAFSLSFTFSPKSIKEAKTVDEIIYTFKRYAAPTFSSGDTISSQSMYLIPPALFAVKFYNKGKENTFLPRYTDCVLKDISVNFAPNGFAAHADGAPIQTTMTLGFEEIEIVDRKRLELGHTSSDDRGLR